MSDRIVCSAVKDTEGEVWFGKRHSDCIFLIVQFGRKTTETPGIGEQGFWVISDKGSMGRFVGRQEAYVIAARTASQWRDLLPLNPGQTLESGTVPDLYSENLW